MLKIGLDSGQVAVLIVSNCLPKWVDISAKARKNFVF